MTTAEIVFLGVYFAVLTVLAIYGSHRYRMAYLYYRHKYKLPTPKGALVAVFDADFVPRSDFLKRTVPFFSDEAVGMVQVRWGHLNREFSVLTQAQSIFLYGHFVIEHTARHRPGCFFNFNGTAGIW